MFITSVPVDKNPAYITAITFNKNDAYEDSQAVTADYETVNITD